MSDNDPSNSALLIEAPPREDTALPEPVPPRPVETGSGRKAKDLITYDPLRAYLREMRRYPPLSREEEQRLARSYVENKDLNAAYRLVTGNLWLVVKIARDYENAARSVLDLIQEGNIGLMEAVKNFDPYRGIRFPSYAVWWIKAYIIRYIIANWRLVKIGTTQAQRRLFFNLHKEKEKLEREGFVVGPKLLAEKLNVRERDVIEMEQRLSSPDLSMDAPVREEGELSLGAVLPSGDSSAEDLVARKELQVLLADGFDEFSKTLNRKEQTILQKRLLSEEKATLQDLAEELSLSRERIRQLENRIKEKLHVFFSDKFGSEIDNFDS
ncbi:MAG: RNA polymerase factor sigma-32 [Deltaproteobacteria bacterium]|nr:RNA polymerase factor sigma-32 [Deltaproteobacteria bacterium]